MFGGGSVQGMITSLSNNKKLLRSKRLFQKERTFLNTKKESLKATEGKLNFKKASQEELLQIGKKIRKQNRKENTILIGIAILIISVFTYFTINVIRQNSIDKESIQVLKFQEKEKQFLVLINKGDEWFEKGKWYNSIFYYEKAKEIFPKNYDINYRLVRSYSFECESEFQNCHEAKKLLDKLFLMFPDKEKDLLEIKGKLEYEY
ncbi:hypothetical protein [Aquimarina rubra]|uniref:Tetratricopeptide repeat protein n=1 Tax=Aquimarina rubra TaxID=1920033 RepID=A0ABW5L9R4_9FLAO